jgi:ornithine carbamoyltransferase
MAQKNQDNQPEDSAIERAKNKAAAQTKEINWSGLGKDVLNFLLKLIIIFLIGSRVVFACKVAQANILPTDLDLLGVKVCHSMEDGLRGVDVVMTLRIQKERMEVGKVPEGAAFFKQFGLTPERLALAKPDAIVMHPGPMNRGVEIDSAVADGAQSVILKQVTFGIAVRMAVMSIVAGN